jgi:hypothetical protein
MHLPAARSCLLHIGAPKTGSTALQRFLASNREELLTQGYLYPAAALRADGHHELAFLSGGGYPEWAVPQSEGLDSLIDRLREEIVQHDGPVILSSENFYLLCAPDRVAQLMRRLGFVPEENLQVLIYIRRQDEAHLSWYNQAVKAQGFAGTIADSIADAWNLWDYAKRLKRWERAFGTGAISVRVYQESALHGGEIRRDICHVLGLKPERLAFSQHRANTKLNRSALEFQRQLNTHRVSTQHKRRFHRELMALCARSAGTGLFDESEVLDVPQRIALLERYARGNAQVARRYLNRDRLFDVSMPSPHPRDGGPSTLTAVEEAGIMDWLRLHSPEATG